MINNCKTQCKDHFDNCIKEVHNGSCRGEKNMLNMVEIGCFRPCLQDYQNRTLAKIQRKADEDADAEAEVEAEIDSGRDRRGQGRGAIRRSRWKRRNRSRNIET